MSVLFYGNVTYKIAYHLLLKGEGYFDENMPDQNKKIVAIIASALASVATMTTITVIS